MATTGWFSQQLGEVPTGDGWLGTRERERLAALRFEPRRRTWRLGRWTAKSALSHWLDVPLESVEILPAPDGAPEAWINGRRLDVSLSISHRGNRALATVTDAPRITGCDLELVEQRSGAFVHDWLAPPEQRRVRNSRRVDQALLANLMWSAKEAAAKLRREGLRLDVRDAVVNLLEPVGDEAEWRPLHVDWTDDTARIGGWWRQQDEWVMVVVDDPAAEPPRPL